MPKGFTLTWIMLVSRSTVQVNGDRLYTLLRLDESKRGVLELRFAPGVAAYAFTFG